MTKKGLGMVKEGDKAVELGNQLFDMTDKNAVLRSEIEKCREENARLCNVIHHLHKALGALMFKTTKE